MLCFVFCALCLAPAKQGALFLGDHPSVSGDGSRFAFEWNDRIWTASTTGGVARCVTPGAALCASPAMSADGRHIAFNSDREGDIDHVFVLDDDSGIVRQVSFHSEPTRPVAFAPDGTNLVVEVFRDHAWQHDKDHAFFQVTRLALLATDRRADINVLFDTEAFDPALSPDGRKVLFRRKGDHLPYRLRHASKESAEAGEIWLYDRTTEVFTPLVTGRIDARNPVWTPDGKGFYYLYGTNGVRNVFYRALAADAKPVQITHFTDDHVMQLSVSADGSTAIILQGFDFWRIDLSTVQPSISKIHCSTSKSTVQPSTSNLQPDSKRRWYDSCWNNDEAGAVAFTPDGKAFAFTTGGDLYVMSSESGEPKLVHGVSLTHERSCVFSPDGDTLYFVSDRGDGSDLMKAVRFDPTKPWDENDAFVKTRLKSDDAIRRDLTVSPDGGSLAWKGYDGRLTFADTNGVTRARGPETLGGGRYAWSPDGKFVVAQMLVGDNQKDILILSTEKEGESWTLTRNYQADVNPTWSPDGAIIAWSSVRSDIADGNLLSYVYLDEALEDRENLGRGDAARTAPVPFEKLKDRVRTTSVRVLKPYFADDSRTIAFASGGVTKSVKLPKDLTPKQISSKTGTILRWTKTNEKSGKLRWIVDRHPAIDDKVYTFKVYQTTNVADYRELAFRTVWGRLRDRFYDANYHGVDWPAMREKYLSVARHAPSFSVFCRVMNMMMGELDASHLGYVATDRSNGEWVRGANYHNWNESTRHTGVRFDTAHKGAGWRIRDVIRASPADRSEYGLKSGDIVTHVNGTEVDSETDPASVLNGPADMSVTLRVDGRDIRLKTISFERARTLLMEENVRAMRETVHEKSKGRFGYLNIEAMDWPSLHRFRQELYAEGLGREGLVIDVRTNHGGFSADRMMMSLFSPVHNIWAARGIEVGYNLWYSENPLWNKPIVVLCSQETGSNGEIFSHAIRQLGRGRLVGRQTNGSVISTEEITVLDFGQMREPRCGVFLLDGTDMEFNGAKPDVEVDNLPGECVRGIDSQLETAIKVLDEDVAAWKKSHPTVHPRYAK